MQGQAGKRRLPCGLTLACREARPVPRKVIFFLVCVRVVAFLSTAFPGEVLLACRFGLRVHQRQQGAMSGGDTSTKRDRHGHGIDH